MAKRRRIGNFKNGLQGIAAAKSEIIAGMSPAGDLLLNNHDKQSKLGSNSTPNSIGKISVFFHQTQLKT